MSTTTPPGWVTLLLRPSLEVILGASSPGAMFFANGIQYSTAYAGEIIATYDRLIGANGSLVGFQVWPVADATPGFFDMLPQASYLDSHPGSHCNILFGPAPKAAGAGDQSLVGQIYRSDSGDIAIAMDLAALGLRPSDVRSIEPGANG